MTWDAIAAIGQLLGTVAVFATLGYLAVQLRYLRADTQRSIRQSRTELVAQQMMTLATDPRLAGIEQRANTAMGGAPSASVTALVEKAGLTTDEALSLNWLYMAQWQIRAQIIGYMDELTPDERATFDRVFRLYYASLPASRLWYEGIRVSLPGRATRYIDSLLARPD